jgi:hypothetical protein
MANWPTPQFYAQEAERLLRLASVTADRKQRFKLIEMAARFREMAEPSDSSFEDAANTNAGRISKSA